jgi:putative membrane protein
MTQYYILAILHHFAVFSLVAILAVELALIQTDLTPAIVRRIGKFDLAYGAVATAILIIGFLRVFYGGKGADYYFSNPFFWTKLCAFLIAAALSAPPTIRFIRWRQSIAKGKFVRPNADAVRGVRGWLIAELAVLATIPLSAAAMAQGIGL